VTSLNVVNSTWVAASDIARGITMSLSRELPQEPYIIVNLPDNLQGAYIFRNGFQAAVYLFVSPMSPLDSVITSFALQAATTAFNVTHSPSDGSYRLQADDGSVILSSTEYRLAAGSIIDTANFKIFDYNQSGLNFISRSDEMVFYYSLSRLHRIDTQQP
jgi:hypothetical protein